MENIIWIYRDEYYAMGKSYEEYISADGLLVKMIWDDGFQEVYEIG